MHLNELKVKKPQELLNYAESLGIENASGLKKQEIYFSVLKKFAEKNGLKIRAYIKGRSTVGVDWRKMGKGPLPATEKVLQKTNLSMKDLDVIELNEAFAAQALYVINSGSWDKTKINKNGGAISLGHPLGCSGARIITTLLNVMEQRDNKKGLATMCIGTGQGIATILERT